MQRGISRQEYLPHLCLLWINECPVRIIDHTPSLCNRMLHIFCLWLKLGCNITNRHRYQSVCLSFQLSAQIALYSELSMTVFWLDYVCLACQWRYSLFMVGFSCTINILQWKVTVWKMLILVGPHRVCVWGCIGVWMVGLMYRGTDTALLSIRSPFCAEMIQCVSLGSYWSHRPRLKEFDSRRRESFCNAFRQLLDVRNIGFDVTGSCQWLTGELGRILWPCVRWMCLEFVCLYLSWFEFCCSPHAAAKS